MKPWTEARVFSGSGFQHYFPETGLNASITRNKMYTFYSVSIITVEQFEADID